MGCCEQATCPLVTSIVLSGIVPVVIAFYLLIAPWYSGSLTYEELEWGRVGTGNFCEQEVIVFAHTLSWSSTCNLNEDWKLEDHCLDPRWEQRQPVCEVVGRTWMLSYVSIFAFVVGSTLAGIHACGCCLQQQFAVVCCGLGCQSMGAMLCTGAVISFMSMMTRCIKFTEYPSYTDRCVDVDIHAGWFIGLLAMLLSLAAASLMCLAACGVKPDDKAAQEDKAAPQVVVGNPVAAV